MCAKLEKILQVPVFQVVEGRMEPDEYSEK